jgi:hypothetical protein
MTKEVAEASESFETESSKKTNEFKFKHDPCTTIADEEDEEFSEDSADKHKEYIKKFDYDSTALWMGIQHPQTNTGKRDSSHKAT